MTTQTSSPRSVRSIATAVTGWLFVVTGTGHALLVGAGALLEPPEVERGVRQAMAGTSVTVAGLDRTLWELFQGFSLVMAVMLAGFGALNLLVLRRAPQLVHQTRALLWLDAAVLLPVLLVSVLLLPPPPILLLGLAASAVALALSRPDVGDAAMPDAAVPGTRTSAVQDEAPAQVG